MGPIGTLSRSPPLGISRLAFGIFPNIWKRPTGDYPAPIIILEISTLAAPDRGANHTLSGLKKQADHDSLKNQADKPILTRASKKRAALALGDQKGS